MIPLDSSQLVLENMQGQKLQVITTFLSLFISQASSLLHCPSSQCCVCRKTYQKLPWFHGIKTAKSKSTLA